MRALAALLLFGAGCHKTPAASARAAAPSLSDPTKQLALRDLEQDLAAARAAIASGKSPVYACDRLAVAARELAGEHDEGVMKLLAEAETVYGKDGPAAWAEVKLKDAETNPDAKAGDCNTVKELLNRVSAKYQKETQVLELVKRYRGLCPRARSAGSARADRSSPTVDRSAQRGECRSRCDRAAWDCSTRCQYCGSCVTSMTWDQCNNICNTCKQGCDQNERFCKSACGD